MPTAQGIGLSKHQVQIIGAQLALYLIWGSAYYVIRIGIDYWPPLLLSSIRFLLAGGVLLIWACWRGQAWPSARELLSAIVLGALLMAFSNGCISWAETKVSTGVTALVLATDPLFVTLASCLFGVRTHPREWLAMALGFSGIVILNLGASFSGSSSAALLLTLTNVAWGLGSVLSKKLPQAAGMMASATMMLAAGVELLLGSAIRGEQMQAWPPLTAWLALFYLAIFCSIIAFNAYLFLLKHVSPGLATSYAYINPVVAILLGMWLLGEHVDSAEWWGMAVIVASSLLIIWRPKTQRQSQTVEP